MLKRIGRLVWAERPPYLFGAIFVVFSTLTALSYPYVVRLILDDAIGGRFDLPSSFYVPLGHLSRQARSDELIERLVTLLGRGRLVPPSDSATAIDEALQRYLLDHLRPRPNPLRNRTRAFVRRR